MDKIIDLFMEIKLSEGFFDDIGGDEVKKHIINQKRLYFSS